MKNYNLPLGETIIVSLDEYGIPVGEEEGEFTQFFIVRKIPKMLESTIVIEKISSI